MQKIVFCESSYGGTDVSFKSVNEELKNGWKVISITPQSCATSHGGHTSSSQKLAGGFAVLLEKSDDNVTL